MATPESVAAVEELVKENRRITYKQIQETLKISPWIVNKILHEYMHFRKVCRLFVPHTLTDDQRTNHME